MRMIALGQAWQQLGGHVRFIGQTTPLIDKLKTEKFEVVQLDTIHPDPSDIDLLLSKTKKDGWVAIDGYHFDIGYQTSVRATGRRTLVLDDYNNRKAYDATILLNQSSSEAGSLYDLPPGAAILQGARYALLRKEFQRLESERPLPKRIGKILVTMGGADPDNTTSTALKAIAKFGDTSLHVKVVAGGANPHLNAVKDQIAELPCRCELLIAVDDMPSLMRWADVAISAGGSTCWELCFFGLPFIAIQTADNQAGVIKELQNHRAAICLDTAPSVGDIAAELEKLAENMTARQAMQAAGQSLVDGKGAMRVAKAMFDTP